MRRFQVLDRNTEVFGRFFLEASAGTGKTFAIEHIAVRALLESVDPLTIDQILIVLHKSCHKGAKAQVAAQPGKDPIIITDRP